jgi:hypothetical protein
MSFGSSAAALDLDKHEAQVVAEQREPEAKTAPAGFAARVRAEDRGAQRSRSQPCRLPLLAVLADRLPHH